MINMGSQFAFTPEAALYGSPDCLAPLFAATAIHPSPVLRLRIPERLPRRRKLPKLMPHHLLRDCHIIINLPIMHLELEPDEIGQDRRAPRLRFDGRGPLAWFGAHDGEPVWWGDG